MNEKELNRLYHLLVQLEDEDEKAALRHAIFIIECINHEPNYKVLPYPHQ